AKSRLYTGPGDADMEPATAPNVRAPADSARAEGQSARPRGLRSPIAGAGRSRADRQLSARLLAPLVPASFAVCREKERCCRLARFGFRYRSQNFGHLPTRFGGAVVVRRPQPRGELPCRTAATFGGPSAA